MHTERILLVQFGDKSKSPGLVSLSYLTNFFLVESHVTES